MSLWKVDHFDDHFARFFELCNLGAPRDRPVPVQYAYCPGHPGFIAQEVEAAAQESNYDFSGVDVPQSQEGVYGLRYAEFSVPLVKATQELHQIIKEQQPILDQQEQKLLEYQQLFSQMEARIEALEMKAEQTESVEWTTHSFSE